MEKKTFNNKLYWSKVKLIYESKFWRALVRVLLTGCLEADQAIILIWEKCCRFNGNELPCCVRSSLKQP